MPKAFLESWSSRPSSHLRALVLHVETTLSLVELMLLACIFFSFFSSPTVICKAYKDGKNSVFSQVIVVKDLISDQNNALFASAQIR